MFHNIHNNEESAPKLGENTPQAQYGNHHILIIDDEADIRNLLTEFLKRKGCITTTAENLWEGEAAFQKLQPSLVLLDLNLPDGSGLQLLKKINEQQPSLPVIIISAYDNLAEKEKAYSLGAYAFVGKPFSMKQIWEHIHYKINNSNTTQSQ